MDVRNDLVAGSVAGIVSTILVYPLDFIRTKLQADHYLSTKYNQNSKYNNGFDVIRKTLQVNKYGIRKIPELYSGMASPLMAQAIYKSVMFGSYGYCFKKTSSLNQDGKYENSFISGMFAGFINSFVVSPVELVRNRLMLEKNLKTMDCIKQIANKGGYFKGLLPTMLRDVPGVGGWFLSFELCKDFLKESNYVNNPNSILLLSGAFGGICFWTIALPFDNIKTIVQTQPNNSMKYVINVITKKGLKNLYKGYTVSILRGIPSASIVFLVQAQVKAYLL